LSRVLPEELTSLQLVKKLFLMFWSPKLHYPIHKRLSLSTPRSTKWSLDLSSPTKTLYNISPASHTCHMSRPFHSFWFDHPNNVWWRLQTIKPLEFATNIFWNCSANKTKFSVQILTLHTKQRPAIFMSLYKFRTTSQDYVGSKQTYKLIRINNFPPLYTAQHNTKYTNLAAVTFTTVNPLNPELNPICYLLALLGAHHFLHVSRIRVKSLTFRRLMSYIYGAPILDVSRSHTTTHHSQ